MANVLDPKIFTSLKNAMIRGDWEVAIKIVNDTESTGVIAVTEEAAANDEITASPQETIIKNVLDPTMVTSLHNAMIRSEWENSRLIIENIQADAKVLSTKRSSLYKAMLQNNWIEATKIVSEEERLAKAVIAKGTYALHIAVAVVKKEANEFVKVLLEIKTLPDIDVTTLVNGANETAIVIAVAFENVEAVKLLIGKNNQLPYITCKGDEKYPIHYAALFGHRATIDYLFKITKADGVTNPYEGKSGVLLLRYLILEGHYDLAENMVKKDEGLARVEGTESPLCCFKLVPSAFFRATELTFWERSIYPCVRITSSSENSQNNSSIVDIKTPAEESEAQPVLSWYQRFKGIFNVPVRENLVIALGIKHVQEMKRKHQEALRLAKLLCDKAVDPDPLITENRLGETLHKATQFGNFEIVEEIIKLSPYMVFYKDKEDRNIIHLAIRYRQEEIFNLISQFRPEAKQYASNHEDKSKNNLLHLTGVLAPSDQLNSVTGAALQMQRELQWFKEVEKLVPSYYRDAKNIQLKTIKGNTIKGKTPREVFTIEHEALVEKGERWMKDTASSCSVVAALIATFVFAAAITVPGGSNDGGGKKDDNRGLPIFKDETAFIFFAVSDALSLFSSTTAILLFLSILTARYAEDDFLDTLPRKLFMGLLSLIFSITTMMIAFSSILYLVFGDKKTWILIVAVVLPSLIVILFLYLQRRLLHDLYHSAFGKRIFSNPIKETTYQITDEKKRN